MNENSIEFSLSTQTWSGFKSSWLKSYILKQSILAKISGKSITNILETAMINALLLGSEEALFILLSQS